MNSKKVKIFKIIMLVLFIAIIGYLTIKLLPMFKTIATPEGRDEFKLTIENLGFKGIFVILGLMFAQMFLAFLPGEPIEILAGLCYGTIGGMFVIFLGAFISSCIIFFAVRKLGRTFIYSFISQEQVEKFENSKWFSDSKKIDFTLVILFLIPGTPKDLIVYISGLLPIKPLRFLLISTFARFPSIISSTIAGSSIVDGKWNVIVITYGLTFLLSALLVFIFRKNEIKNNV